MRALALLLVAVCASADAAPMQAQQMVIQTTHSKGVKGIAFLPNGQGFVSASEDNLIHIRKPDGRLLRVISAGFPLWCLAVSPDGEHIAAAGLQAEVRMWRTRDGVREPSFFGNEGAVTALAFSPNGQLLASGSAYKTVILWQTNRNRIATLRDHNAVVHAVAFSADSQTLASGGEDSMVRLWDVKGQAIRSFKASEGSASALAFRPDGKRLAVGSSKLRTYDKNMRPTGVHGDDTIGLWDPNGTLVSRLPAAETYSVRFSADGSRLVSGDAHDNRVRVWDGDGAPVTTFKGFEGSRMSPSSVDVSADGSAIAGASMDLPAIKLWDASGVTLVKLVEPPKLAWSIDYASDAIVSGASDGSVRVWTGTGKLACVVRAGQPTTLPVAFSPDGKLFAIGGSKIGIYRRDCEQLRSWPIRGFQVARIVFSPDGEHLVTATADNSVTIWSVSSGTLERTFKTHADRVESLAISPDGKRIAVGSSFGKLGLWSLDGTAGPLFDGHGRYAIVFDAAFSHDGKLLASVASGELLIHSLDGKLVKRFSTGHEFANVGALAFSPDDRLLATSVNTQVAVYDLAGGSTLKLAGHTDTVTDLAFAPDGKHLVSSSFDTSLRLWRLSSQEHAALLARDQDWLAVMPDGTFDASPHGGTLVAMARGMDAWGVDQFAPTLNRPDLLLQRLDLGSPPLIAHYKKQHERRLRKLGLSDATEGDRLHAPEAKIVTANAHDKQVELRAVASDSLYPLRRYDVFVNDVPLFGPSGKPASGMSAQIAETIELGAGDNKIELSATNERGVESYRALVHKRYDKPARGDLYFLGFGVSRYRDPSLSLAFAHADAASLGEAFGKMTGDFQHVLVKTFTDEACTVANIAAAKQWLSQARVDDTVVVFIAGHGVHDNDADETYYYLTHEADAARLAATAAPFDLIESLMQGLGARKKLLLMDTCESGEKDEATLVAAATQGALLSRGLRLKQTTTAAPARPYTFDRDRFIYNDLLRRSGAIVFSSSRGGELSYETQALQHGVFTAALLRALSSKDADRNHDGRLSSDELSAFVMSAVPPLSGGLQHPTVDRDNIAQSVLFPFVR